MHFFTEHTVLPAQNASDKYGPDGGTSSDLYNISARFELPNGNTAKAFACQDGLMLVQQSSVDSDLVNILIKPNEPPKSYLQVKYYIYRGILKSSLISESNITPADSSNNELIARFWAENENHPDPKAYLIGFGDSLPDSTDIEDILLCTVSGTVEPIYVKEGEWFGDFGGTHETEEHPIDFEVLIDNAEEVITTLGYLRNGFYNSNTSKYQINVTSKTNLEKRRLKEQVLSFLDPAALFGMFYNEGYVNFTEYSGSKVVKSTNSNSGSPLYLYTVFLNKFETKHTVYLDIRSDRGFSYNFYGNYDDQTINNSNIKIGLGKATVTAQKYHTNDWPIIILSQAQDWTGTSPVPNKNRIGFQLRLDDVEQPLIFLEDISIRDGSASSNWIKKDALLPKPLPVTTADLYTKENKIHFPNKDSGTTRNNVARYIKLYYFRQNHSQTPSSTVMPSSKYFNNAFIELDSLILGTFKSEDIPGTTENPIRKNKAIESCKNHLIHQKLNETDGTGNFAFCAKSGAYWERTGAPIFGGGEYPPRVLLYTTIYKEDENNSEKKFLPTYNRKFNLHENPLFEDSKLRNNMDLICRSYKIDNNDIKILGINWYSESGRKDISKNHKENLMLLGLTHEELTAIYETTGLAYDDFHRYIYLDPDSGNPLTSDAPENMRYHKYTIRIQGIASTTNGGGTNEIGMITPQLDEQDIVVYSRDNQFFHSKDFSEQETVSPRQNQIEMHIYHDGVIKITDNIDLSLVRKRLLSTREALIDDNTIANDQSLVQQIHYYYHTQENQHQSIHIANFDIVMADKMAKNGRNNRSHIVPGGYALLINYQTPTIHNGVDAGSSYRHNTNRHIYTTARSGGNTAGLYENQSKKIFMVRVDDAIIDDSNLINDNQFRLVNTFRFFGNLPIVAALIGALVNETNNITSEGLAYGDGSCYPSANHVNGFAMDTGYLKNSNQNNANFMSRLHTFGFRTVLIGYSKTTLETTANAINNLRNARIIRDAFPGYKTILVNGVPTQVVKDTLHDNHLHSENFIIRNGVKELPL